MVGGNLTLILVRDSWEVSAWPQPSPLVWHTVCLYLHSLASGSFQCFLVVCFIVTSLLGSTVFLLQCLTYLIYLSGLLVLSIFSPYLDSRSIKISFKFCFPLKKNLLSSHLLRKQHFETWLKEIRARMNYQLYLLILDSLFLSIPGLTLLYGWSWVKLLFLVSPSSNRGS